jgi:TonB family protein
MNFALNVTVKVSIIMMSAAFLSVLLRRVSASTRHAVWVLAIASAMALPAVAAWVPELELPVLPKAGTSVRFLPAETQAAIVATVERGLKPSTVYLLETLPRVLAWVWMLGVALLTLRISLGTLAVTRLSKSASVRTDESWRDLITELSRSLSIKKPVRLLFSDSQVSPMTWGVVYHTILLPLSALEWSGDRRSVVLAHELAHVKRNDGVVQMFVEIVCSIYWFNPLVWYGAHRVRIERERACDDQVLNLGAVAEDYADHLVQVVRGLQPRRSSSFAAVAMAQPSQLETRLVSILNFRARRHSVSKAATAFLCAVMALLTIALAEIGVTEAVPLPPVLMAAPTFPMPELETEPQPTAPQRTRIGNGGAALTNMVVPPQVIESSPATYTDEALAARIEGTVTLEAAVDITGKITTLRVIKGLGSGLDERAMSAVLNWRFAPASQHGTPVQAITQIDVDFKLPAQTPFIGDGVYRQIPPTVITRVEPRYTDEARTLHYGGTVVVQATIGVDGSVKIDKVVRELEHGLTENAIEALQQWKFKPGMKNGIPVPVSLNIEVNFNLK